MNEIIIINQVEKEVEGVSGGLYCLYICGCSASAVAQYRYPPKNVIIIINNSNWFCEIEKHVPASHPDRSISGAGNP